MIYPFDEREEVVAMPYERIVISSGHGKIVRGASGIIDEVDEARKVVEAVANGLRERGVQVKEFHDDVSTSQSANLNAIVNYHNAQARDLDVSVHFNAFEQVEKPMGCEVLYLTQGALASELSAAISAAGRFINRGGKKRTDLKFLNSTEMPSVLLEVCFVDSETDCNLYNEQFDEICKAIADVLGGLVTEEEIEPPEGGPEPVPPATLPRIDIEVSGDVLIFVNGEQIGTKG